MRQNKLFLAQLTLIVPLSFLATKASSQALNEPQATDLTQLNDQMGMLSINRNWQFYWQNLISPGDSLPSQVSTVTDLPHVWNGTQDSHNETKGTVGYGTYRKVVKYLHLKVERLPIGVLDSSRLLTA